MAEGNRRMTEDASIIVKIHLLEMMTEMGERSIGVALLE